MRGVLVDGALLGGGGNLQPGLQPGRGDFLRLTCFLLFLSTVHWSPKARARSFLDYSSLQRDRSSVMWSR
jgi:hypothetical protein